MGGFSVDFTSTSSLCCTLDLLPKWGSLNRFTVDDTVHDGTSVSGGGGHWVILLFYKSASGVTALLEKLDHRNALAYL